MRWNVGEFVVASLFVVLCMGIVVSLNRDYMLQGLVLLAGVLAVVAVGKEI